jgi:hypothetical protein
LRCEWSPARTQSLKRHFTVCNFACINAFDCRKDEFVGQNLQIPSVDSDQNNAGVPQELAELGQLILAIPGPHQAELAEAFQRIVESVRRRHRILVLVQEALSQLRLDIKYLMFDLDVTRRERDDLRQQLEDL